MADQQIILSGAGNECLGDSLRSTLIRAQPHAVGVAAAFVSIDGVKQLGNILQRCGNPNCRLIAGIDNAVTHPAALYEACNNGWSLRIGKGIQGIFHPKIIVAGNNFSRRGIIQRLCFVYVGSSNLTTGGLKNNLECGLIAESNGCLISAADSFAELWNSASPATEADLQNYAARFAEKARFRSVPELTELGINDSRPVPSRPNELRAQRVPTQSALSVDFAIAAWAGLESFTGQYTFQLEFPKNAGKVISRLIRDYAQVNGRISVFCPQDESTRLMQFRYYPDNSMFRLNIPNDVPGISWAREHKEGIAIVEQGLPGGAPLRIRLLKPGADAIEIVGRSAALGTWGKTPTRYYGWY